MMTLEGPRVDTRGLGWRVWLVMKGPERRADLQFASLDDAVADARRLLAGGYRRAGNWSLGQACGHLTFAQEASLDGFGAIGRRYWWLRLAWPITGRLLDRWVAKDALPAGAKGPAEMVPPPDADDAAKVEAFARSCARVRDHAGPFAPSPFFGRLGPERWRAFHRLHAALHLGHLVPEN